MVKQPQRDGISAVQDERDKTMNDIVWGAQKSIEHVLSRVASRGWKETPLAVDRFADLRQERRFLEAQVAALYEQYFLPERHEFEWQVLSEIVNAVVTSPAVEFAAVSIAGGVIGNAAYDLLKALCSYAASKFEEKLGESGRTRAAGFRQLAADAEKVKSFFQQHTKAQIGEIEEVTGIPREKVYPLMKLAGLDHHRRGNPCFWETPSKASPDS
jgi:hypothetical protein